MSAFRNVLVGVDVSEDTLEFPEPTQEAIQQALRLGETNHAEITLMTVFEHAPVETGDLVEADGDVETPEHAAQRLHAAVAEEAEQRKIAVQSKIVHGRAWQELIREVLRGDYDVLIIGTRNRSSATRLLFGSTAMKLMRKCPCPVLVTKPGLFSGDISTIVAADDLGAVGERVVEASVTLARLFHARLMVVHAAMFPLEAGMLRNESPRDMIDSYREKVQNDARTELSERVGNCDARTVSQGVRVEVFAGRPESVIERAVVEEQASLLVMGTIGRGGIPGFFIGNTAERLLAELQCSVLAIKPDDFACPVSLDDH